MIERLTQAQLREKIEGVLTTTPQAISTNEITRQIAGQVILPGVKDAAELKRRLPEVRKKVLKILDALHRDGVIRKHAISTGSTPGRIQWMHETHLANPIALRTSLAIQMLEHLQASQEPVKQSGFWRLSHKDAANPKTVRLIALRLKNKGLATNRKVGNNTMYTLSPEARTALEEKGITHAGIVDAIFEPHQPRS
mgnify:CR=1 FL=1